MKLQKNLGTADRIVRLTFAAIVILLFMLGAIGGPIAAGLLVLSAIFLVTVLFSFCPVYTALNINTKPNAPEKRG